MLILFALSQLQQVRRHLWAFNLEDSKPVFSHDTLAHDDALPYQTNHFTWHSGSWCTAIPNQFFDLTRWLMVLHHHTKFSDKRLSGSDDIIQAKPRHMDKWFQYIYIIMRGKKWNKFSSHSYYRYWQLCMFFRRQNLTKLQKEVTRSGTRSTTLTDLPAADFKS